MASFWDSVVDLGKTYGPDIIKAGVSYAASQSASKKAKVASGQEDSLRGQSVALRQQQIGLANNADARSQQLFDEWGSTFLPAQKQGLQAQQQVLSEAGRPIDPNVEAGLASADYASADAAAAGTRSRQQQAVGIAPNSGQAIEENRLAALDSTAGKAAAATTARRSAETTRLSRMSAAAAPLANAGNGLVSAAGGFASAANTGAGQAAAGLNDVAGDYGADASAASAVAGKAGGALGDTLSDAVDKIFKNYESSQLEAVTPTVKPLPIMNGGGATGTFNGADGQAVTHGYDMEGTSAKIGMPDGYNFLGGAAPVSSGLSDFNYASRFGSMSDAELNTALGTSGAMKAIDSGGLSSTVGKVAGGVGGALGIYSGIQQGGLTGYSQAAGGAAQVATAAGVGGSTLSTAVPILGAVTGAYGTLKSIQAGDTKSAALSGAATGASIGSIIPGVGTVIGGVVGAVVGALGSIIHGKDYSEEKVRDTYYDGVSHGMTVQDSLTAIAPKAFYQAFAGEFRGSRSVYPPRQAGYGQKDEDKFIDDMKGKISAAQANGTVAQGADAQAIYDKVVDPWFQTMGGYKGDPRYPNLVNEQKQMTVDLINRYISGSPVDWNVITKAH